MKTLIPLKQENLKTLQKILDNVAIMPYETYEVPIEHDRKAIITIIQENKIEDENENEINIEQMNARSIFFEDEEVDEFSESGKRQLKNIKVRK